MKFKKVLALILATCLAVSAFAGCTAPASPASSTAESPASSTVESPASSTVESPASSTAESTPAAVPATEGMYPGTPEANSLTVNLSTEPPELNTLTSTYSISFVVIRQIMTNLVSLDKDDKVIPGVAESWTMSEDGITYDFKLRKGMKWTNGDEVTAKDFTFAWSQLINPELASEYAYFAYIFKNAEKYYNGKCKIEDVGFKAVDDYNLKITLENPTAYALFLLSFGSLAPVNQKFYEQVGADNYSVDADKFCTNGPYKMDSWTHESNIVLKKNPDWFRADEVTLETLKFAMINDTNAALNSFKAGELDMVGLTGDQIVQMQAENYPLQNYSDGSEFHVLMNNKNKYLSNKNLRLAIHHGYNREAYVKSIVKDRSVSANSFTCPGVAGADGTSFAAAVEAKYGILNPPQGDTAKAKEYLEVALKELNITKEELSKNLSMNCGDSDVAAAQAAFFQEQLRTNLGLDISIKPMTTKAQSAERVARNYVMDFTGWGPDYNDPMTFLDMWVTGAGNNSVDFSNARYDELIDLAAKETDGAKRQEYFLECEKILSEEVPISATYWRERTYLTSEKITGNYWRTTFQDMEFGFATIK